MPDTKVTTPRPKREPPCRCPGCNGEPVDVGNFGRFLLVCPAHAHHDRESVTGACVGRHVDDGKRRMVYSWREAVEEWAERCFP